MAQTISDNILQPSAPDTNKRSLTGFTNLQSILDANRNNRLGETIGSGVQSQANQLNTDVNKSQQDFKNQSDANNLNTSENQQFVQNTLQNPVNLNQNALDRFSKIRDALYSGPTTLANADQLSGEAQNIGNIGQSIGSAGGRMGLLQRFVGNPNYTSGQQQLDTLLLGQTGAPQLAEARRSALAAQASTNNAMNTAQVQGQENQNKANEIATQTQNQLGQATNTFNTNLQNKATQLNTDEKQLLTDTVNSLGKGGNGVIPKEIADKLGLKEGTNLYNIDPEQLQQFISVDPNKAATQYNATSDAEKQQIAAYNTLAGGKLAPDIQSIYDQYSLNNTIPQYDANGALITQNPQIQNMINNAKADYNERNQGFQESFKNANQTMNDINQYVNNNDLLREFPDRLQQGIKEEQGRNVAVPANILSNQALLSNLSNQNGADTLNRLIQAGIIQNPETPGKGISPETLQFLKDTNLTPYGTELSGKALEQSDAKSKLSSLQDQFNQFNEKYTPDRTLKYKV